MSDLKPEIEGVSVVLVGSFNPAIFHPVWFARENLIQQEEAERADLQINSPELSIFSIGWLAVEVTTHRFVAQTSQFQYADSLRDFVLGTFTLLRHTPIKQMGINRQAHYRSADEKAWHELGDRLAPKDPWDGLLKSPGMRRVQMLGKRPDGYKGKITVGVEPSLKMKGGFGAYFEVNDHYEKDVGEEGLECEHMMKTLTDAWESSLDRAIHVMQGLMKKP